MNKQSGFTLIELLVVISIMAILYGAMVPLFKTSRNEIQLDKVYADFEVIRTASHSMYSDTRTWPCLAGLAIGGKGTDGSGKGIMSNKDQQGNPIPGWNGPYLEKWLKDPWNKGYLLYFCKDSDGEVLYFISSGPDGASGFNTVGACTNMILTSADDIMYTIVQAY